MTEKTKQKDRTTRSRRSSKNSTKREQGGRGACEEPAACGRRATKYQYISPTPARVEANKSGGTRASGAGAAAPGASGPTNEEQRDSRTLTRHREEDGRSRRSPRQRRKDRRTRLRSEATRAKSRDQGRRDKARNPQRSPAEQSKTEGELMQRTTPEAETGERMQQRSGRTRRQPWNPRTTKEEPKACAKETGHGKGAEGKRQALRHPEAGKEIENKEPQEESRTKEQREQKRRKSWRSRSHHRSRTHHRQPLTPSADTREGREEATETVEGVEKGGAGWREAETGATEVRAGKEEATARRAEEKTPEAEEQAREAPDERGG